MLLKLLKLSRQRRLAYKNLFGGTAKVLRVGEGDEVLEISQIHNNLTKRGIKTGPTMRLMITSLTTGVEGR